MGKERLAAFSDGVLAIIITIMVLELKVPEGASLDALRPLVPVLLGYALSFVYIGIYWNNHHHLLAVAERVNGAVLWANMHLLFWLSLVPFATRWMGESHSAPVPTAVYGVMLLMAAVAFGILVRVLVAAQGPDSLLASALGRDRKGKFSPLLYLAGVCLAGVRPWIADALYVTVALIWLIPDRRMERAIAAQAGADNGEPPDEGETEQDVAETETIPGPEGPVCPRSRETPSGAEDASG